MANWLIVFLTIIIEIVISYLFGSILFSDIVKKKYIKDPRTFGSKNPGTTNAIRTFGIKGGILVAIGDILKCPAAFLITWSIYRFGFLPIVENNFGIENKIGYSEWINNTSWIIYLTVIFCQIGHIFPIYHNFKGGKGVAVYGGYIIMISPWILLLVIFLWLIVCIKTRYNSLASIVAGIFPPILIWIPWCDYFYLFSNFNDFNFSALKNLNIEWANYNNNLTMIIGIGIITLVSYIIILWKLTPNIKNLINKNEKKII